MPKKIMWQRKSVSLGFMWGGLGYPPTGRHIEWIGAAFFTGDENKLRDIWVLGDLDSLRGQLSSGVVRIAGGVVADLNRA